MFQAQVDESQRLLRITYWREVVVEDTRGCFEKVRSLLEGVEPGFQLLADFSGVVSIDPSCAPFIGRIMDLCNEKGVSSVVRVMPDERMDIGLTIMSFFHYGREVHTTTVKTLEEAAHYLVH